MSEIAAPAPLSRDLRLVGLVGAAHFLSHFFQLALPPLFPRLREAFDVGYTELGVATMLFYATSGLAQTPSGFLVDRLGARTVLVGGLGLLSASIVLASFTVSFWMLLVVAVLGGLGNSVFHPADYAMLTAGVDKSRIARAYSVHSLGGNLGWAAAPVTVVTLAELIGWRAGLLACGVVGLGLALLLYVQTAGLGERRARASSGAPELVPAALVLLSAPVILCFVYFALLSVALIGLQTFLPPALVALHGIELRAATAVLTAFLLGASAGVLAGGIAADRGRRHDLIVTAGLFIAGVLILLIALVDWGAGGTAALVAAAGFASGMTMPSRDMLVRASTPPGATGRVFGFVYSGLDLGSSLTPPVLGFLIDAGAPIAVFEVVVGALALTIGSVLVLRRFSRH
jgi:MFS transporter, FSR family, fosmidomycin resistance protein